MKTIFAELYNRIMDFFQQDKGEQTSQCATNRLQVILMHDRTKLDTATMAKMREELIEVFSKYVIIDQEELEIGLKSEGDSVALMLNIPIIRAKTEEEMAEALKEKEHDDETVEEAKEEEKQESSEEKEKEKEKEEDDDDEAVEEETSEKQEDKKEEKPEEDDEEDDETVEETAEDKKEDDKKKK